MPRKMMSKGKKLNPDRMSVPMNEFTHHYTGDMPTMDTAWHHWMQDKYKKSRGWFNKKMRRDMITEEERTISWWFLHTLTLALVLITAISMVSIHNSIEKSKTLEYQNGKLFMLLAVKGMTLTGRNINNYSPEDISKIADSLRVSMESK